MNIPEEAVAIRWGETMAIGTNDPVVAEVSSDPGLASGKDDVSTAFEMLRRDDRVAGNATAGS